MSFEDYNFEQRRVDQELRDEYWEEEGEQIMNNMIRSEGIIFELRAVNDEGETVLLGTSDESFHDVALQADQLDNELYNLAQSIHADNNDMGDFSEASS